jgi:hypothetical protein
MFSNRPRDQAQDIVALKPGEQVVCELPAEVARRFGEGHIIGYSTEEAAREAGDAIFGTLEIIHNWCNIDKLDPLPVVITEGDAQKTLYVAQCKFNGQVALYVTALGRPAREIRDPIPAEDIRSPLIIMSTFASSPAQGGVLLNELKSLSFEGANKTVAESLLKLNERALIEALLGKMGEIAGEVEKHGWSSQKAPSSALDAHFRVASHLSRVFDVLNVTELDASPRIPMAELALLDIVIRKPEIVGAEFEETVKRYRNITTPSSRIPHRFSR